MPLLRLAHFRAYAALDQTALGARVGGTPKTWAALKWTPLDAIKRIRVSRGRKDFRGDFSAGRCSLEFNDTSGSYDALNKASRYAAGGRNQTLPGIPVKVETVPISIGGGAPAPYPVFWGLADPFGVDRSFKSPEILSTVDVFDMIKLLNGTRVGGDLPDEQTGERIWRMLSKGGWPEQSNTDPAHRVWYGSLGASSVVKTRLQGHTIAEHIMHCMRTEGLNALAYVGKEGYFRFFDRHVLFTAPWSTPVATFGPEPGDLAATRFRWSNGDAELCNQVECSIMGDGEGFSVVAVDAPALNGATTLAIEPMKGDIDAGRCIDFGTGRVVELTQPARKDDEAVFFEPIDVDIDGGTTAYHDPNVAIAADNASQLRYGKRTLPRSNLLLPFFEDAQAMAEDILLDLAEFRPRVTSLQLNSLVSETISEQILKLAIGELVVAKDRPPYSGELVTQTLRITGMDHDISKDAVVSDFYTMLAPAQRALWTLKDADPAESVLGTSTALSF